MGDYDEDLWSHQRKKNFVKNIIWINLSKDSDCTADICSFDTLENLDYKTIFVISSFEL